LSIVEISLQQAKKTTLFIKDINNFVINSYAQVCPLQVFVKDILWRQAQKGRADQSGMSGSKNFAHDTPDRSLKEIFQNIE
jgi:hypothetical protein